MHARLAQLPAFFAASAGLLLTAGCQILPEAQSDPTRFYVLSSAAAGTAATTGAPVVQLRPVEVAEYLRSRSLVVRRGGNEVEFREFARWGEPLEAGVARVLREELLARGAAGAVLAASARRDPAKANFDLSVRVLAAEGAANGAVDFHAGWELRAVDTGTVAARGDFRAAGARWDGKNEAALAAGLSQAVGALAAEIASALPKP
ncbi:MAG: membrane integrity-associated transporter subunit PqiC [Opitutaceae bacterium]|nr:membrane integrity-associated transporter subunit PqiC [Opitutaceae bacterium]